ncbi:MAG: DUF2339 domain-containing protein, partial [Armatimonadetes bacterium]|nr:DUF2339 domain-containing protein [Armatimonadota bacterium]
METLAALAFLGCCLLGILVFHLYRRIDELKRETDGTRRYVSELTAWASQIHQYLSAHRVAPAPEAVEPARTPEPERAPVAELPKPSEPEMQPEPPPERPVRVPPVVTIPTRRVDHHPPRPAPSRPVKPAPAMAAEARAEAQLPLPIRPGRSDHVAPWRPRPDLELTIGTRWLSRVGMVAVLAALVFLVWYLYDRGVIVITREMVIGAGLLLGLGLVVGAELAHRRGYEPQSEALTGGGAATLYLTLWVGLHLWGVFGATAAFVAMALVTAGAACQALRHDSQTIAVLAWVAGYLVPLFVGERHGGGSEGSGAYGLFI